MKIFNEFKEKKKNLFMFCLLTAVVFSLIFYNWISILEKPTLSEVTQIGTLSQYSSIVKHIDLTISKFSVNFLEKDGMEVKLNLIIYNNGEDPLVKTPILIPWDQLKGAQFPSISDISTNRDDVAIETSVQEVITASKNYYSIPIKYDKINRTYKSVGATFTPIYKNTILLHQFGNFIEINWKKPIMNNTSEDISIKFILRGVTYHNSGKILDFIDKIIKNSPINFYPISENLRLKLPISFPFAESITLNEVDVNLPYAYSATNYEAPSFNIHLLERKLEPSEALGFISYIFYNFSEELFCEENIKTIEPMEPVIIKLKNPCVLKYPFPIITEMALNTSQRWYLSPEHHPVRNKLHLMKFAFNPTFKPQYEETPGFFLLKVDYKLKWWFLMIPLILVSFTLIISFINFGENQTIKKITFLIPFIIALFSYWSATFMNTPPLHPNLLDLTFLLTIYIAISSILKISWKPSLRIIFPFFVSFVFMILQFHFNQFGDLFLKLAMIFPIISFSIEFPFVATILTIYLPLMLNKGGIEIKILIAWIFRLLSLALLFNILRKYLFKKLKIKNAFIKKLLSNYFSFIIIWHIYTIIILLIRHKIEFISLINTLILVPLVISLLIMFQEKFLSKKLH